MWPDVAVCRVRCPVARRDVGGARWRLLRDGCESGCQSGRSSCSGKARRPPTNVPAPQRGASVAEVPETKGKSLEQIQVAWAEHDEKQSAPSRGRRSTSIWPERH